MSRSLESIYAEIEAVKAAHHKHQSAVPDPWGPDEVWQAWRETIQDSHFQLCLLWTELHGVVVISPDVPAWAVEAVRRVVAEYQKEIRDWYRFAAGNRPDEHPDRVEGVTAPTVNDDPLAVTG